MQDIQSTTELQMSPQGTNEAQSNQLNTMSTDAPAGDSGSLSVASNDNKKVSREDIELVRYLAVLEAMFLPNYGPLQLWVFTLLTIN
jgi:hypothetical protein